LSLEKRFWLQRRSVGGDAQASEPRVVRIVIAYLVVYVTLSTTGLLLLRSRLAGAELANLPTDALFLLGGICYAVSFLTWMLALRRFEVVRAFPIFAGTSYAAVMLGAVLILGERLTEGGVAGAVLVGAGILLIGL
jgi:drug/metabolite transporter (DMT)-like permease